MEIPKLREMRERQGLTQKELADVSGVSVRSVAGYEGGARVRPNTARKLAKALDVKVADLMGVDAHPKGLALSPRDTELETAALPEVEVLFEAAYTPDSFDEVASTALEVSREARRDYDLDGLQIAYRDSGDKIVVRIEPVSSPSSRSRRRSRMTTKTSRGRKAG